VLTYEEYFDIDSTKDGHLGKDLKAQADSRRGTSWEDYKVANESKNLFENDMLEMQYRFWETQKDKEERLKLIWIDLKRKNALGGLDQRTTAE